MAAQQTLQHISQTVNSISNTITALVPDLHDVRDDFATLAQMPGVLFPAALINQQQQMLQQQQQMLQTLEQLQATSQQLQATSQQQQVVLQQLRAASQQQQAVQQQILGSIQRLDVRQDREEQWHRARDNNRIAYIAGTAFVPLKKLSAPGILPVALLPAPAGFPRDRAALESMTSASIQTVLRAYGQPLPRTLPDRRSALLSFIGCTTSS